MLHGRAETISRVGGFIVVFVLWGLWEFCHLRNADGRRRRASRTQGRGGPRRETAAKEGTTAKPSSTGTLGALQKGEKSTGNISKSITRAQVVAVNKDAVEIFAKPVTPRHGVTTGSSAVANHLSSGVLSSDTQSEVLGLSFKPAAATVELTSTTENGRMTGGLRERAMSKEKVVAVDVSIVERPVPAIPSAIANAFSTPDALQMKLKEGP
jgi:hypothetical protein